MEPSMRLFDFSPTTSERHAINKGFYRIEELTGHNSSCARYARDEHLGYGNRHDRIPLIAARGLCSKWFLEGLYSPDILLRDSYYLRPAAVWFQGYAANFANTYAGKFPDISAIEFGAAAYKSAFDRMLDPTAKQRSA
jgi:hypothetical protein